VGLVDLELTSSISSPCLRHHLTMWAKSTSPEGRGAPMFLPPNGYHKYFHAPLVEQIVSAVPTSTIVMGM
jgi:hypothetical protein